MENSEIRQQITKLGKLLVDELDQESSGDTLSKWIAHYIAEQIHLNEHAEGEEKERIEQKCFELILSLWQHHADYPGAHPPFKRFDSLFSTIDRLDPSNTYPLHPVLVQLYERQVKLEGASSHNKDQSWADIALQIDSTNKELIDFCLRQAALSEINEDTKEWLENAVGLPGSEDVGIVIRYLSPDTDDQTDADRMRELKIDRLNQKIENLKSSENLSQLILKAYESELELLLSK